MSSRMRPRLLPCVARLPTISESEELDEADLEEYMESIRELCQPPHPSYPSYSSYPLHGPLRGHRRDPALLLCPRGHVHRGHTHGGPVQVSDVWLTVTEKRCKYLQPTLNVTLEAQSVFAGL